MVVLPLQRKSQELLINTEYFDYLSQVVSCTMSYTRISLNPTESVSFLCDPLASLRSERKETRYEAENKQV